MPEITSNTDISSSVTTTSQQEQTTQQTTVTSAAFDPLVIQAKLDEMMTESQLKVLDEHWVKTYWRPAMAWLYMLINFMDFVVFPFLAGIQPVFFKIFGITMTYIPWQSLTLSNGGMIHLAFGGILGIAAWTRAGDKLKAAGQ